LQKRPAKRKRAQNKVVGGNREGEVKESSKNGAGKGNKKKNKMLIGTVHGQRPRRGRWRRGRGRGVYLYKGKTEEKRLEGTGCRDKVGRQ